MQSLLDISHEKELNDHAWINLAQRAPSFIIAASDILILKFVIKTGSHFRSDKSGFSRLAKLGRHGAQSWGRT